MSALSDRQQREVEYHREHAKQNSNKAFSPVNMDVLESKSRRWWNAYWFTYDLLLALDIENMRVLIPGCGFGDDAIRLPKLGAKVDAFDISPEIIQIAKNRATHNDVDNISFHVMPCENIAFPDDTFDLAFILDILHHVDIAKSKNELARVIKSEGILLGDELYTHSIPEKLIRKNPIVDRYLYPWMQRYIYGHENPYITKDEHKVDERELGIVLDKLHLPSVYYFNTFSGRVFPQSNVRVSKLDRQFTKHLRTFGRFSAGRVVFEGRVRKL